MFRLRNTNGVGPLHQRLSRFSAITVFEFSVLFLDVDIRHQRRLLLHGLSIPNILIKLMIVSSANQATTCEKQ